MIEVVSYPVLLCKPSPGYPLVDGLLRGYIRNVRVYKRGFIRGSLGDCVVSLPGAPL